MDEHGCREKVIKQFRTVRIVIELDCGNTYINSIILPMFEAGGGLFTKSPPPAYVFDKKSEVIKNRCIKNFTIAGDSFDFKAPQWYNISIFFFGYFRMKALEQKILTEGAVLPGNVLKVGSFLNQKIDSDFIAEVGREIARLYEGCGVTKILTVEASGIAIAVAAGIALHVPVVFAKKHRSANMPSSVYTASVYSFTHKETYEIAVGNEYIESGDNVLIVDDFLANGNAVRGLMHIIEVAGARLAGCAIAIEKAFQSAGDKLRSEGVRVESLAIIERMTDNSVEFRAQE